MKKENDIFQLKDYQAAWDRKRAAERERWEPLLTDDMLKYAEGNNVTPGTAGQGCGGGTPHP